MDKPMIYSGGTLYVFGDETIEVHPGNVVELDPTLPFHRVEDKSWPDEDV